jgi:hypothetical protein
MKTAIDRRLSARSGLRRARRRDAPLERTHSSTLKRLALYSCGTRQQSATVTCSKFRARLCVEALTKRDQPRATEVRNPHKSRAMRSSASPALSPSFTQSAW